MFIGHFAVAMAAKKASPKVSLGTLVVAAQFLDLLWPVLILLGVEHVRITPDYTAFSPLEFYDYPVSHSLVMALFWSAAFGGIYYLLRRDLRGAAVLGLVVVSHWVLDLISHRADLPVWPGGTLFVGLGLWNSVVATIAVEVLLFGAGIWVYLRATQGTDRTGTSSFWLFIGVLSILYVSSMLGVPPSVTAVAVSAVAGMLMFALWGYWIDRHRGPATP